MPLVQETRRKWRFVHPDGDQYIDLSFYTDRDLAKWAPWIEAFERFLAAEKAVREAKAVGSGGSGA